MTINYGTLTNEQKECIDKEYDFIQGKTNLCHAAAIIADNMTPGSNQRVKSNAFAAVLTYLVWQKRAAISLNRIY